MAENFLTEEEWENLPYALDKTQLRTCKQCGHELVLDFFEGDSSVCKVCAKKNSGKYLEYADVLEGIDVDLVTLQGMVTDFKNFLKYAWWHLGLPEPTRAQYEFCDYLQYKTDHTIINAFRGIGKSWITSVYVVWMLWRNPEFKILVISASKERADSFSIFTKRLFQELTVLSELVPDGDRQSNKAFDIGGIAPAHAPSVKSAGITGQITGSRADLIIADDVEVPDNSATEDARDKLLEKCKEFVSILTPLETSRIIYLGTPQSEESIYTKLSDSGYDKFIIPARYPDNMEKYGGYLAKYLIDDVREGRAKAGQPTDPARFTDEELMRRELMIGRSTFALQMMIDTSLSDAEKYPLKTSDFIVMDLNTSKCPTGVHYGTSRLQLIKDIPNIGFSGDRIYAPMMVEEPYVFYQGSVLYIDPSGRGTDEVGWAVVKQNLGKLYLVDFGGLQGGYSEETLAFLASKAKEHVVKVILIEDNFGDGMYKALFTPIVRRVHPKCEIIDDKVRGQKEARIIDVLEPVLNQHRLVVDKQALVRDIEWALKDIKNKQYSLVYQLTHLTKDKNSLKHDDRLDALAGAVKYWQEWLNKDTDKAVADAKRKMQEEELERLKKVWEEQRIGKKPVRHIRDTIIKSGGARNKQLRNERNKKR